MMARNPTQGDSASPRLDRYIALRHHQSWRRRDAVALNVAKDCESHTKSWISWTVLDVGDSDLQLKLDSRSQRLLPCSVQFCLRILDTMEMIYGVCARANHVTNFLRAEVSQAPRVPFDEVLSPRVEYN